MKKLRNEINNYLIIKLIRRVVLKKNDRFKNKEFKKSKMVYEAYNNVTLKKQKRKIIFLKG